MGNVIWLFVVRIIIIEVWFMMVVVINCVCDGLDSVLIVIYVLMLNMI